MSYFPFSMVKRRPPTTTCPEAFDTLLLALGTIDHSIIVFEKGPIYKSSDTLSNDELREHPQHTTSPSGTYLQDFSPAIAPLY